jgi:hypothetical protein
MSAMVGMLADRLTNSLNNSLNGTVTFGTAVPSCCTRVFLRETKLTVDSLCAHHGPAID